jgi:hypothetical protein
MLFFRPKLQQFSGDELVADCAVLLESLALVSF